MSREDSAPPQHIIVKFTPSKPTYAVKRKFLGKWHIRWASEWDYDHLSLVGRPEIEISSSGYGTVCFGAFNATLDAMKDELKPNDVIQFAFAGSDEGDEVSGRGAAWFEGELMKGSIVFMRGMSSLFEAEKIKEVEGAEMKTKRKK